VNVRGSKPEICCEVAFEKKRGEHHPACRISVSISDREIRRIFGVYIKPVIERADLRVRIRKLA